MKLKLYQIDAFTDKVFSGNPAAVCLLDKWIDVEAMQAIASENNLAETAFVIPWENHYAIRWFTPEVEVDLCGHATLAAAFVLFKYYNPQTSLIKFETEKSGILTVKKSGQNLEMDFPADHLKKVAPPNDLVNALRAKPIDAYQGKTDYLLIYNSQYEIEKISPDFSLLKDVECRGVIVSSRGEEVDFVSRFFAPQVGINEDPVTGSAHTSLTPYWANKLNKTVMTAQQLSARKGELTCEWIGDRVKIIGKAVSYLVGEIEI